MKQLNCEYVREVYADVLHDNADAGTVTAVRAHLVGCAECRAEAKMIEELLRARHAVPAGLHGLVVASLTPQPRARRFAYKHIAIAATIAAALIGGPLYIVDSLQRLPKPNTGSRPPAVGGLGVITVEAAMVAGTSSLQDLTVEELEQLLGEIES